MDPRSGMAGISVLPFYDFKDIPVFDIIGQNVARHIIFATKEQILLQFSFSKYNILIDSIILLLTLIITSLLI